MARDKIILSVYVRNASNCKTKESAGMIIGIDWNNTLQDMISELVKQSGHKLTNTDFARWDDPSAAYKLGMSSDEFVTWCWKRKEVQLIASPFDGAKEALGKMKARGHHIRIITHSFLSDSQIANWLERYQIPFDDIVKVQNKAQAEWDVLIDDSPAVLRQMIDLGLPVIKFARLWNSSINTHSLSDWRSICQ